MSININRIRRISPLCFSIFFIVLELLSTRPAQAGARPAPRVSHSTSSASGGYGLVLGVNYSNPVFDPSLDSTYQPGYSAGISFNFSSSIFNDLNFKALYSHRVYGLSPQGNSSFDQVFLPVTASIDLRFVNLLLGAFASYGVGNYNSFGNSVSYEAAQISKIDSGAVLGFGFKLSSWKIDLQYYLGLNDLSQIKSASQHSRSMELLFTYQL